MVGKILVIDDSPVAVKLLTTILSYEGYTIKAANDSDEAFELLNKYRPDLILLDIMMPKLDGYKVAEKIKQVDELKNIPIIMITALDNQESKIKGLQAGAEEFITKPFDRTELLIRVANLIKIKQYTDIIAEYNISLKKEVKKKTEELDFSYVEIVIALARIIDGIYESSGRQTARISRYSTLITKSLGTSEEFLKTIIYASTIYDIGKIRIPDEILYKKENLTDAEYNIIKKHTIFGKEILDSATSPYLNMAANISLFHHENWDTSGYPISIGGDSIPLEARIIKICDQYDALRCKRPHRNAFTHEQAVKIITQGDKKTIPEHFDPSVLEIFIKNSGKFATIFDQIRD